MDKAKVSVENRAQIAVLNGLVEDLRGQIAAIVGNHVGFEEARIAATSDEEKPGDKDVYIKVASAAPSASDYVCVIYIDPPGYCMPC